jgi:hypothetical protein
MVVAVSGHRGFGGLLRQRSFRLLWSGETSSQLGNAMAGVAMPLLAVEVLHASNFAVASLAAGPLTRRYTSRGLVLNAVCTTPFTLLIPLTAPGPRLAFCVAGVAMLEGGLIIASIIMGSFEQAYCPPEMLGRVITSTQMLTYGTAALGALLAGGLASWLGPRNAMWIMLSAGLLPGGLLLTPMFIRHRDLPQRPLTADGTAA